MSKNILSFSPFLEKESTEYLAENYPRGKVFAKKYKTTSVIHKFIKSLGIFIQLLTGCLFEYIKTKDIDQADILLEEWETSVKIPLDIPRRDTIEGRKEAVKCLISKIPVYNIDNGIVDIKTTFSEYVRCLTGIDVTITTAQVTGTGSAFPLKFPVEFGIPGARGSFVLIIEIPVVGAPANNFFPMPFPVQFFTPTVPDATMELIDKILDRVVPSFMRWQYIAVLS